MPQTARFWPVFLLLLLIQAPGSAKADLAAEYSAAQDSLDLLRLSGRLEEAESFARELLDRTSERWGVESAEHASAWTALANVIMRLRRMEDAYEAADRSVTIARALPEADPLVLGFALTTRGYIRENRADLRGAYEDLEEALRYLDHDEVDPMIRATALSIQAYTLFRMDRLEEAEDHSRRSLAIREQHMDAELPDIAWNLSQLAAIQNRLGRFEVAREHLERAVEIRLRISGAQDWWYLNDRIALGWTEYLLGHYEASERILLECVEELEAWGGADALQVYALEDLGVLEFERGDYPASRRYHERVLELRREIWGEATVEYASSLYNLGSIASAVEDLERARGFHTEALGLLREEFGDDHVDIAKNLIALAYLEILDDRPDSALVYLHEVREMPSAQDGRELIFRCELLSGEVHRARGELGQALEDTDAAIQHWGGDDTLPDALASEAILQRGKILLEQGDHASALECAKTVDRALEHWFAAVHPARVQACRVAAEAERADHHYEAALTWALRGERIRQEYLHTVGSGLSERLLARTASRDLECQAVALSLLTELEDPKAIRECFEVLTTARGVLFEEAAARHRPTPGLGNPRQTALRDELYAVRQQLAHVAVRTLEESEDRASLNLLAELRVRREELEEDLLDAGYRASSLGTSRPLSHKELSEALDPGEALVSYLIGGSEAERRYHAFVSTAGSELVLYVDLGPASTIDAALSDWYREVSEGERIAGRSPRAAMRAYRSAAGRVSSLVWDPVTPLLEDVDTVFVVPEARLHLLSWASLPDDGDGYLIENGLRIHRVLSERELLVQSGPVLPESHGLLALGGIQYGAETLGEALQRGEDPCLSLDLLDFQALPASGQEAEMITQSWRTATGEEAVLLRGSEATESEFARQATESSVLHLATHAWYLGPECIPENADWARLAKESPLLLSGMAMAGANDRDRVESGAEDGILTAEEICGMDLRGVELAVLSACSSGAGPVVGGDGVYGLPRAFRIAGVKEVVLSLWPVADRSTHEYMVGLYERWLSDPAPVAESVYEHTRAVLSARRLAGRSVHPYHWAAFVATGQP